MEALMAAAAAGNGGEEQLRNMIIAEFGIPKDVLEIHKSILMKFYLGGTRGSEVERGDCGSR